MNARRRGGSGLAGLVVFLLVAALLVGGLVFGDRYLHNRVERESAAQLQIELGTPDPPTVEIEGVPFLTQVATQNLRTVKVSGDDVGQTNQSSVVIDHVDLVLTDVVSQDWFKTMTVTHAEGTARLSYDELQSLAAIPLTYVGGGRFLVKSSNSVLGYPVGTEVTGGLALNVDDQTVTLTDPEIRIADVTLPEVASKALIRAIVGPIPVSGVPFQLRLTSVDAQDDGLHIGLVGENIAVQR